MPITPLGSNGSFEGWLDTLGNYLSTPPVLTGQPDLSYVYWVLGDVGMGPPPGFPSGIISPFGDRPLPYGASQSTGGSFGYDMDEFTVPILVIQGEHKQEPPESVALGSGKFYEHPGYRALMELAQNLRKALRIEPTFGGSVATSTISEIRPLLIEHDNKIYRGARLTATARSRRPRH
jgi:hypothetical protein